MNGSDIFTVAQKYSHIFRFPFSVRPHLRLVFRFPFAICRHLCLTLRVSVCHSQSFVSRVSCSSFLVSRSSFSISRFSFLVSRSSFSVFCSPFLVFPFPVLRFVFAARFSHSAEHTDVRRERIMGCPQYRQSLCIGTITVRYNMYAQAAIMTQCRACVMLPVCTY